ncbi:MAG: helix-turn-helix transcriptional regulator [Phycisphaeraceae bacterium]|nr:helix-turn-helix transcriptional regulator [Phycisphaeraceae bacterium]
MPNTPSIPLALLTRRRAELGITLAALARRSGVSEPTVKRIFAGRIGEASFANVAAVADALGLTLALDAADADHMRRTQARKQAEHVARLVQGTSALESQAVDARTYEQLVERTYHELLAGPKRRLWAT